MVSAKNPKQNYPQKKHLKQCQACMMHKKSKKLNILIFYRTQKNQFWHHFLFKNPSRKKNHSDQETLKKYFSQRNHSGQF